MTRESVNVAIIGCGRVSGHHARSIRKVDGVHLRAVCDLVESKAATYGAEFGVPYFASYREMLRQVPEIDTVAVATPSGMHYEHALDIMERYGRSVIVEKPTFMRPEQVLEAFSIADGRGIEIYPVFQNRYNRAVRRVKKALTDGELGDIRVVGVRVRWCRPQRYYNLSEWRGTYAQDGGALTNQGIHHVDLLRHLAGEIQSVSAQMRTLGAEIEVEDTAVATFTYAGGAVGSLEVTTSARPDDFEASISLVCSKGLAQIGGIAVNELQIFTPDPAACAAHSEDFSGSVYGHGHRALYEDLAATRLRGLPYPVDRHDCLKTIQLLHAFYRSAETGQSLAPGSGASARLGVPDEKLSNLYRTPLGAGEAQVV